jgi:hypothetical protein
MGDTKKKRTGLKLLKRGGVSSIPEIKHAFDQLEHDTHNVLKMGQPMPEMVKAFKKIWKRIFHRPISHSSAEEFLRARKAKPVRKFTRKMKGGAQQPLSGAPLDSSLGPGVYGAHGSFPAYWSQGGPNYPEIGITESCGVQDITPKVPISIGSNQVGGNDLKAYMEGRSLGPSPELSSSALQK